MSEKVKKIKINEIFDIVQSVNKRIEAEESLTDDNKLELWSEAVANADNEAKLEIIETFMLFAEYVQHQLDRRSPDFAAEDIEEFKLEFLPPVGFEDESTEINERMPDQLEQLFESMDDDKLTKMVQALEGISVVISLQLFFSEISQALENV